MSKVGLRRLVGDHFEPDDVSDPKAQRQLRGNLEQIDYAAYDANRKVMSAVLGAVDAAKVERMALATAQARTRWIAAGMAVSDTGQMPTPEQGAKLSQLRTAYEELAEAYDGLRRAIERGYLTFAQP